MFNILIIVSCIAIITSIAALVIGSVALSIVIGVKNSTHQVVWKEAPKPIDPFSEEVEEEEEVYETNPNKRFKKHDNSEALKVEESTFADLDDPTLSSNFN